MRSKYTIVITVLLIVAVAKLYSQDKPENTNLGVYNADMYYNELGNEWKFIYPATVIQNEVQISKLVKEPILEVSKADMEIISPITENILEEYNYDSKIVKKTAKDIQRPNIPHMVYFPEGFAMTIPKDKYEIVRSKGKYTFIYKDFPDEAAHFDVYVTDFDLQSSLEEHNHFCVSKNKNLAVYAVYTIDEKTDQRIITGFRMFYTLPINNNKYVTVRSLLFKEFNDNNLYIKDIVNLNYATTPLYSSK